LQLSQLAASNRDLAVLGVVKETGVDDASLADFHTHYFHKLPVYKDEKWKIYKAMGGRNISVMGLASGFLRSRRRHAAKKIETIMGGGDGWMQGGVLIFDRHGELRYAYDEKYGSELDMETINRVIQVARGD
jgi:hypothetical protein